MSMTYNESYLDSATDEASSVMIGALIPGIAKSCISNIDVSLMICNAFKYDAADAPDDFPLLGSYMSATTAVFVRFDSFSSNILTPSNPPCMIVWNDKKLLLVVSLKSSMQTLRVFPISSELISPFLTYFASFQFCFVEYPFDPVVIFTFSNVNKLLQNLSASIIPNCVVSAVPWLSDTAKLTFVVELVGKYFVKLSIDSLKYLKSF